MAIKKVGRIACVLALTGLIGAACSFTGCTVETDHPEATITVEFNGTSYALKYKLYRNMYPQTVRHFIELADSGFYNNTIIHDYTSSYLYAGGYEYDSESYTTAVSDKALDDYLDSHSKEQAYYNLYLKNKLTPSVYNYCVNDNQYSNPLPTLIGEFNSNVGGHVIEPDTSLKSSYGCLRMYYTTRSTAKDSKYNEIYLKKNGTSKAIVGDYDDGKNSATSLFNIQLSSSTSSDETYCIFAVLQNTSKLSALEDAIDDYIEDNVSDDDSFTSSSTLYINNYDFFNSDGQDIALSTPVEATYSVPTTPIRIKSVKITKY
jgi:cyclophilin family peptidyl-prolyl cis-trans isomerase